MAQLSWKRFSLQRWCPFCFTVLMCNTGELQCFIPVLCLLLCKHVYVLGYTLGSNKPTIVRHCTGLLTNYDCGCAISSVFLLHYEKPAGGLVVNITTLKSHWWQQWYVCQQIYHILQNFIPQRACLYHLIAGWVLTFAHNNTPFGQHL